jgi:hypothetical protein
VIAGIAAGAAALLLLAAAGGLYLLCRRRRRGGGMKDEGAEKGFSELGKHLLLPSAEGLAICLADVWFARVS